VYILQPNCGKLNIANTSTQVAKDTPINNLLTENMGECKWAACTYKPGHPNSNLVYHTDGVFKEINGDWYKQIDGQLVLAD
jgi:hypothetical protein